MTLSDLFFLASVLLVLVLSACVAASALRGRLKTAFRLARLLGLFLASYAVALMAVALATPRRVYAPGARRCFDDWCVAALSAEMAEIPANPPCQPDRGGSTWLATIEVSSVARRIRQRARDARAELEDGEGRRYQPCPASLTIGTEPGRSLWDELGPGESFRVLLPFRLPAGSRPAGLIVHHGDFPGIAIIGADQSLLHRPALQQFR